MLPRIAGRSARNHTVFPYTSGRFIYNEKQQLDARQATFDVEALKRVVLRAVGANHCTDFRKTHEGSFNKIFALTLDHSTEIIARIPNRLVPHYHVTASEVATMDLARTALVLPVPRVLAWSAQSDEIGSEYIVMEKSSGVTLLSKWKDMRKEALKVIEQVMEAESTFSAFTFSQHGGVYYRKDVDSSLRDRPLYEEEQEARFAGDRFRVGPSPDWDLWRGDRALMKVDRGPWPDLVSYMQGRIRIEQEWLTQHAHLHPCLPEFASVRTQDIGQHIEALNQLHALAAHLTTPYYDFNRPILWHSDLHGNNIMLSDAPEPDIADFIDWQFMSIAPLITQAHQFADFVTYNGDLIHLEPGHVHPKRPDNYQSLPQPEQDAIRHEFQMALRHKVYEIMHYQQKTTTCLTQAYGPTAGIVKSLISASRTWYEGLHHLRETMYEIVSNWSEYAGEDTPIPACVDVQALERYHLEEYPRLAAYDANVAELQKRLKVGMDGWVENENYESVMKKDEEERQCWDVSEMGGPYPFQDGAPSYFVGS